ncbi:MAG: SsrA-binding protein SmpB [Candidatus Eremiobacteraeota bacterium]|nr:SsrA-binding protein SmpB [Candidatus Eremiobacteraeota bacterium]MBV9276909.1 SsrA-binding protein SmpB [Candidatus Eremiobacteraeota bacterium]
MAKRRRAATEAPAKPRSAAVDNRRARYEYEILESIEAGIALTGTEIKAIRAGGISLAESYARVRDGELWLLGMHVPPYKEGSFANHDPVRPRKLLLHKAQIVRLGGRAAEKGLTIVPLRLYFTRGKAKVEIGLARGKKLWDKRRATAERELQRELARHARR